MKDLLGAGEHRFDPAHAGKAQPTLPHHPGAIRFFKEAGIWKG